MTWLQEYVRAVPSSQAADLDRDHRRGDAPQLEATGLALQLLAYDRRDEVAEVGAAAEASVVWQMIDHPTRIEIDGLTLLAPTMIAIDAADDVRTIIRILREGAFSG
jgi:hypothetical protein